MFNAMRRTVQDPHLERIQNPTTQTPVWQADSTVWRVSEPQGAVRLQRFAVAAPPPRTAFGSKDRASDMRMSLNPMRNSRKRLCANSQGAFAFRVNAV